MRSIQEVEGREDVIATLRACFAPGIMNEQELVDAVESADPNGLTVFKAVAAVASQTKEANENSAAEYSMLRQRLDRGITILSGLIIALIIVNVYIHSSLFTL